MTSLQEAARAAAGASRVAGILLHPTSLPGPQGIGELGPATLAFLDFLQETGQRLSDIAEAE